MRKKLPKICSYCNMDENGNHESYCPMNTVDTGLRGNFAPDWPTDIDAGLKLLGDTHNEDNTDTDFMNGYRFGLRMGIMILMQIKRNQEKENPRPEYEI